MRYTGPKVRLSRQLGIALTPKAEIVMKKKPNPPGQHSNARRRKASDYKMQLLEKQRLRAQYNVNERQFRRYYEMARRSTGNTGDRLVEILEMRLDAMVLRAGFARTIYAARQYVNHGHVVVNGEKVDIPSYRLRTGDTFAVRPQSLRIPCFIEAIESGSSTVTYLSVDRKALSARLIHQPIRADIPVICDAQVIIEFYSR